MTYPLQGKPVQQELVSEVLRTGVVGLGRAGAMMLGAIARHPKVQVTAAADLHREHLDRFQEDFESGAARRELRSVANPDEETALRVGSGYSAGAPEPSESLLQSELGNFVVTCARADLRLSAEGVVVHDDAGVHVIAPEYGNHLGGRGAVLDELYSAVVERRPVVHDGEWAKATMEVCLAMLESARQQQEIELRFQVPTRKLPGVGCVTGLREL
jgi:hypothetical protein